MNDNIKASGCTGEIVLYQPDDQLKMEVTVRDETVWLSQQQMALLFGKDQSVIGRHIANVFKEGEVDAESNMQKMHNTIAESTA